MSYKFLEDTIANSTNAAASFNSDTVDAKMLNQGSFHVLITTGGAVSWTVSVQGSNDGTYFTDLATPTSITGTSLTMLVHPDLTCLYYRVAFARTSGTLSSAVVKFGGKG